MNMETRVDVFKNMITNTTGLKVIVTKDHVFITMAIYSKKVKVCELMFRPSSPASNCQIRDLLDSSPLKLHLLSLYEESILKGF